MRDILEKDLTVKILSTFLAIILWFQVTSDEGVNQRRVFEGVPVEVQNLGPGLALFDGEGNPSVRLTVQGSQVLLNRLNPKEIKASVNLRGAASGSTQYRVEIHLPKGLSLVEVTPPFITVKLELKTSKEVPVRIQASGEPGEEFQNRAPVMSQGWVTIEGAKSKIDSVSYVFGWADIKGATQEVRRTVEVVPIGPQGKEVTGLSVRPGAIDVRVPIAALPPGKNVPVAAKLAGSAAAGYKVKSVVVEPIQIKVRGLTDRVVAIKGVETAALDLKGAKASLRQEIDVALPAGAFLLQPAKVTVLVEIVPDLGQRTFSNLPVTVRNLDPGLKTSVSPTVVTVVVEGPKDLIERLTGREFTAAVDADNLEPGTHRLALETEGPPDIRAVDIRPKTAEVKISK